MPVAIYETPTTAIATATPPSPTPSPSNSAGELGNTTSWNLIEDGGGSPLRSLTADTTQRYSGDYSLKISAGGQSIGFGAIAQKVTPGRTYQIRVAYRSDATWSGGLYFRMNERGSYPVGGYVNMGINSQSQRSGITDFVSSGAIPTANAWIVVSAIYTVPANVYWVSPSVYAYGAPGASLWFEWVEFSNFTPAANGATAGDLKSGLQSTDHGGWILLDGRLKSTLTPSQQAAATAVGIGTNLPNPPTGAVLVKGTPGSIVGSATITQANLPNVALAVSSNSAGTPAGTLDTQGAHTHAATVIFHEATGGGFNGGRIQSTDRNPIRTQSNASEVSIQSAGSHSHNFTGAAMTAHSHTAALGGAGTAYTPLGLGSNLFIYLGS